MARKEPRISVLKLAEYLVASPIRRRRIIKDQAQPKKKVVAQHRRSRGRIVRLLRKREVTEQNLLSLSEEMSKVVPSSEWDRVDLQNAVQGVDHFRSLVGSLDMGDRVIRQRRRSLPLLVSGVSVSVEPSMIFQKDTGAVRAIGALKLSFVKSWRLDAKAGEYGATILRMFLEDRLEGTVARVDPQLCQVVDVFGEQVFIAPKAFKRRMDEVRSACEEIADAWSRYEQVTEVSRVGESLPGPSLNRVM